MITALGEEPPTGAGTVQASLAMLDLCTYAADRLKAIGFVLHYTSMRSEACYYQIPGARGVLRVAAHRFGRTERRASVENVLACITFPPTFRPRSSDNVDFMIAAAVGRYVMAQAPGQMFGIRPTAAFGDTNDLDCAVRA